MDAISLDDKDHPQSLYEENPVISVSLVYIIINLFVLLLFFCFIILLLFQLPNNDDDSDINYYVNDFQFAEDSTFNVDDDDEQKEEKEYEEKEESISRQQQLKISVNAMPSHIVSKAENFWMKLVKGCYYYYYSRYIFL